MGDTSIRLYRTLVLYDPEAGTAVATRCVTPFGAGDPLTVNAEATVRGDGGERETGMVEATLEAAVHERAAFAQLRAWAAARTPVCALVLGPGGRLVQWDEPTRLRLPDYPAEALLPDGPVVRLHLRRVDPAIYRHEDLFAEAAWAEAAGEGSGARVVPAAGVTVYATTDDRYYEVTVTARDFHGGTLSTATAEDGAASLTLPEGTYDVLLEGAPYAAPTLTLYEVAPTPRLDRYADSVSGSDAAGGLTPATALESLAALRIALGA